MQYDDTKKTSTADNNVEHQFGRKLLSNSFPGFILKINWKTNTFPTRIETYKLSLKKGLYNIYSSLDDEVPSLYVDSS